MNKIPWLHWIEPVYCPDVAGSERRLWLRIDQKSIMWRTSWVGKFPGPGDLLENVCELTMAIKKACMLLSEHKSFVGFGKRKGCVQDTLPVLVEVYQRHELRSRTEWTANEEIYDAAQVFLVEKHGMEAWRRQDMWRAVSIAACAIYSSTITSIYSFLPSGCFPFLKMLPNSTAHWIALWRSRFQKVFVKALMALNYKGAGMNMIRSTAKHPIMGFVVFLCV